MGFFSWKTADTKQTICSSYAPRGAWEDGKPCHYGDVTLLLPSGKKLTGSYSGYGELFTDSDDFEDGKIDIYAAVYADITDQVLTNNNKDEMRNASFGRYDEIESLIKIVKNKRKKYDEVPVSENAPSQGFFFDDVR